MPNCSKIRSKRLLMGTLTQPKKKTSERRMSYKMTSIVMLAPKKIKAYTRTMKATTMLALSLISKSNLLNCSTLSQLRLIQSANKRVIRCRQIVTWMDCIYQVWGHRELLSHIWWLSRSPKLWYTSHKWWQNRNLRRWYKWRLRNDAKGERQRGNW